jgi:putative SOS response-associated peptidase YedK
LDDRDQTESVITIDRNAQRDSMPVVFAGIWEGWRAPDGEVLRSFAILTCGFR